MHVPESDLLVFISSPNKICFQSTRFICLHSANGTLRGWLFLDNVLTHDKKNRTAGLMTSVVLKVCHAIAASTLHHILLTLLEIVQTDCFDNGVFAIFSATCKGPVRPGLRHHGVLTASIKIAERRGARCGVS